eukprot:1968232-Rhodomonas_salina.1
MQGARGSRCGNCPRLFASNGRTLPPHTLSTVSETVQFQRPSSATDVGSTVKHGHGTACSLNGQSRPRAQISTVSHGHGTKRGVGGEERADRCVSWRSGAGYGTKGLCEDRVTCVRYRIYCTCEFFSFLSRMRAMREAAARAMGGIAGRLS